MYFRGNGGFPSCAFVDGNTRTAFIAAGLFLRLNGVRLNAGKAEAVMAMRDLGLGALSEEAFAEWLRDNC